MILHSSDIDFPEQILTKECFVTVSTNATPSLALRLAGEKGYAEVKSAAERLFREGANEFIRRCASKTLEELQ